MQTAVVSENVNVNASVRIENSICDWKKRVW
jgi:hypothetical protein